MSTIGDRLKEERSRLNLSQSAFAQRTGIHRNTQMKYESGERFPDSTYLDAVSEIGVDVPYLFSGIRSGDNEIFNMALLELDEGIYHALGYTQQERKSYILDFAMIMKAEFDAGRGCDDDEWVAQTRGLFVSDLLSRSPVLADGKFSAETLDVDLLSPVITGVDLFVQSAGFVLSPNKKAQLIAMLYRAFKASGKVDPKMIEEAVRLAAG
ncbi:MAG: XRE family transcriptional regulator [Rhodocyclaceae bacterium]|nr:MAG: XRE family transcriptional regulator [Rhodocyclaceae bacterium]